MRRFPSSPPSSRMKRRLGAKFAMLYLFDEDKDELWTCAASGSGNATRIIKLSIDSNSLAATATRTRESSSTYLTSGLWLLIGKGAIHAGSCRGASQGRR